MTACGPRTPDVGRIYDALLGGKDNFAEDRGAARRLIAAIPDIAAGARANREFLGRAVRFLAAKAGIRQFLDSGAGLPTMGNSHAAAREVAPGARVAYVDIDPVVISHGISDGFGLDAVGEIRQVYRAATASAAPRTRDGIARFFDGLEMVPPGLCDVASWRAGPGPAGRVLFLGGIGRKQ